MNNDDFPVSDKGFNMRKTSFQVNFGGFKTVAQKLTFYFVKPDF